MSTSTSRTLIEHWNGTNWAVVPSPNAGNQNNFLYGIAGSPGTVWAVGSYANATDGRLEVLVEHWNGSKWSLVSAPNVGSGHNYLSAVTAVSPGDVWAVGSHMDGGSETLIEHWDGLRWTVVDSPNAAKYDALTAVTAVSATDVWAAGWYFDATNQELRTLTEHWDGTGWSLVASPNVGAGNNQLWGIAAVPSKNVWAVGEREKSPGILRTLIEHWDGNEWHVVASPNPGTGDNRLFGVARVSSNYVWTVGLYSNSSTTQALIERWNGQKWSVTSGAGVGTSNRGLAAVATVPRSTRTFAVGWRQSVGPPRTLIERHC